MIFSDNYTESQLPTILVADDMAISRKLLNTLLSPRYNVVEAKNGLEVLDLLKNSNVEISCILLDMLMPVVDGIKVLDFMRENNLLDMIPVIVITAMSSAAGKISCYEAGASEIIEKPYDPKILINRIDNLLKLSARLRSARAAESDGGGSAPFRGNRWLGCKMKRRRRAWRRRPVRLTGLLQARSRTSSRRSGRPYRCGPR